MEPIHLTDIETMEPRQLPVVVALGALSATLVLAFGRVFATDAYIAPVLAAALLPHVIGALARWRGLGNVAAAGASLLGLVVLVLVAVPGVTSLAGLGNRLSGGWDVITLDSVPIRSTHGAVLLASLVVWIAATTADELAFRRQASLGALAPGLMVLIWIAALGIDDGQWLVVAAFGACGSVFLGLQHQVLLEHRRTRIGPRRLVDAPRLLVAGAFTGALAVGVGVVAAPALPGGDKPLFETSGIGREDSGDSYRTSVPPLLDVGDKLRLGERQVLFTVEADREDYWRIVALDEYRAIGGGQWTLTAEGDEHVAEGLDESDAENPLTQRYQIRDLSERWMPAAYEPVSVTRRDVLVVRSSATLVTLEDSVFGMRYTVVSDAPSPELGADAAERSDDPVPDALVRFTQLPDDFPTSVIAEADAITAGLATPYDRALALRDFFRDASFTYDTNVTYGDDEDAIARFLVERNGFCVQFASAYATMARSVGIPARVAVGFTPGTRDENGVYKVTNFDAHAWPEVWLGESIGWTHAFDPTPPSADAPGGSDLPGEPDASTQPTPPETTATTTPTGSTPTSPPATTPVTGPGAGVTVDPDPTATDDTGGGGVPWIFAVVLAVLVLALGPVAIVLGLKGSRRSRRRRRDDPAAAITGAWAEAVDDLADHRHAWAPSSTPLEVARQGPVRAGEATAEPLRALADAYGAVRYGAERPEPNAADDVWDHVDTLHHALGVSLGFFGRLRARMDPSTLRRRDAVTTGARRQPDPAGWSKPRMPSTKD